jgi:hypothetical protein
LFERLSRFGDGGAWGYYQDCLKMLTMLVMTGNFVNFYEEQKSSFCLPTCQIVSPVDGEIVNGIVPVKLYAEDNNQLSKIELYFLNNKIYETYLSSKNVSIEYNWDTTSFLGQKGVFKSICYNINGSSYTYFIEVEISSFSQTISDGSGKVKVLSQDFFVDTTQDVVLTFIATKDIYLGKIEVVLPEIFRNNFSSIEIKKRYGWPSISFCNFDTQSLKLEIGINKIFYSESFDIVIKNFVVQNSLGEHKILIKTKSNGGLLQEISSQPSIKIYTTNSKNKNKKVISLNKDYKNDKIVFNSPIVEIYNAKGKKVAEVKNGVWDGSDDQQNILKSGIYFYKTQDGEQGSIVILK